MHYIIICFDIIVMNNNNIAKGPAYDELKGYENSS
jgi:hypothetical protein